MALLSTSGASLPYWCDKRHLMRYGNGYPFFLTPRELSPRGVNHAESTASSQSISAKMHNVRVVALP